MFCDKKVQAVKGLLEEFNNEISISWMLKVRIKITETKTEKGEINFHVLY